MIGSQESSTNKRHYCPFCSGIRHIPMTEQQPQEQNLSDLFSLYVCMDCGYEARFYTPQMRKHITGLERIK